MSLGSTVFYDPNDNGVQDDDPLEIGIAGVTVNLYYDADGDGSFNNNDVLVVLTGLNLATEFAETDLIA